MKKQLSKCCKADFIVKGIGDFNNRDRASTLHTVCVKCGEPCDIAQDKPIKNKDFLLQFWNGYIRPLQDILPTLEDKRIIKAIEQLISANKLLEKDIKQLLSDKDEQHREVLTNLLKQEVLMIPYEIGKHLKNLQTNK